MKEPLLPHSHGVVAPSLALLFPTACPEVQQREGPDAVGHQQPLHPIASAPLRLPSNPAHEQ